MTRHKTIHDDQKINRKIIFYDVKWGNSNVVIGINPTDFTFTNLYGVKEGKLYNLNLTPIEKLSVEPIVGVHSSKTA